MKVFKKIFQKLKTDGFVNTLKKVIDILMLRTCLRSSSTIFLVLDIDQINYTNKSDELSEMNITQLGSNKEQFYKINPFGFLDISNKSVYVSRRVDKINGFVVLDTNQRHTIYGLGEWSLNANEAWIGPAYVKKEARGIGINKLLILESIGHLRTHNIKKIYTAINERNIASLRSFKRIGFIEIGKYKKRMFLKWVLKSERIDLTNNKIINNKLIVEE